MVRVLASHQCGLGSIPGPGVICGLSLLLVLDPIPKVFLVLKFSSLHKTPTLLSSTTELGRLFFRRRTKQLPLATKTCVLGHVGYSCQNEKVNAREHIPLLIVEHFDTRSRFNQFHYFLKLPSKITRCRIPSFSYNPIDYAASWAVVYTFSTDKRPSLAFNGKARNLSCLRNAWLREQ